MTTGERLVFISTLTSDTALQHFLNISTGGGDTVINYVVQGILSGVVKKTTILTGELQKITPIGGEVKKQTILSGQLQSITPLEGEVSKINNLKGDIECQQ